MDSFVTETDFYLLQNDKYTFFVLARILHGNCNFVASNHKTFIICHSCEPFPLWIWTSDDISQSEKEEIYKILDKNSFLTEYEPKLFIFAECKINCCMYALGEAVSACRIHTRGLTAQHVYPAKNKRQ